jgi:hypothetical protein
MNHMTTNSLLLHQTIRAHIEAQFQGCEVRLAESPDEEWLAIIDGVAYVASIGSDDQDLVFHPVIKPIIPVSFTVVLMPDEWTAIINARPENDPAVFASHDEEYEGHRDGEDAMREEQRPPSDAWQLLEVANDELANDLIEHFKMSSEIETITAGEILSFIARMKGEQ